MNIKFKPMGAYQTNCYILEKNGYEIIIDPGENAYTWVCENVKNPIAILNTHGHFDHMWSNQSLKQRFNIPIYCPKDDVFMLKNDIFQRGIDTCEVDFEVEADEMIKLKDFEIKFWHFPGHTPGCSALQIEDMLFSGDFLFYRSIGRVDFPYSNANDMKKSILKVLEFKQDLKVYPGHGEFTTLKNEQKNLPSWLNYI